MDKRVQTSEGLNQRKCFKNEKEIYSINYEKTPNFQIISDVSSTNKAPFTESSSKDTVELSLEVEIANSLKQLITSAKKNGNSPLVDVTIIRPSEIDCLRSSDASSAAVRRSEVNNLIAAMERQKQHKRRLIELYRKEVESSVMNPIMELQEAPVKTGSKHLILRQNEPLLLSPKRKLKRPDNVRTGEDRIGVMSDPTKPIANYTLDAIHNAAKAGRNSNSAKQPYAASISILKPLVGEIRKSLKHLEAKIVEGGDHHPKNVKTKLYKTYYTNSNSSTPQYSEESVKPQQGMNCPYESERKDHHNTHQIYAAPTTFEKLRQLLACQNPERHEHRDDDKDKPCLCQHCGMIGLLVDSQKGPVVPSFPLQNSDASYSKSPAQTEKDDIDDDFRCIHRKNMSKSRQKLDVKAKYDKEHFRIMCDLSSRLEALENRVIAQEQNAVPKEYFKRVINKLLNRQTSQHTLKSRWTQYSRSNLQEAVNPKPLKNETKMKNKNIQIETDCKRRFIVNPVMVETNLNHSPPINESRANETQVVKNETNKAISAVSDFFTKFGSDKDDVIEENKTILEKGTFKEKNGPIESFWRWGEEIIKPGMDLKTKILSLLDEQFQSTKNTIPKECKKKISAVPTQKNIVANAKNCKNNGLSDVNIFDAPKPFEDKEDQKFPSQPINTAKPFLANPSSQALKKVLDLMSEKIYNDHVKPTVEAIKEEQKCLNKENTEQIYNIKAAMNAAFYKMNTKETQVPRKKHDIGEPPSSNENKFRRNVLGPAVNNKMNNSVLQAQASPLLRKSAIPVRVANASLTESSTSGRSKYNQINRSLIPRLKSPTKEEFYTSKPADVSKLFAKAETANHLNKAYKDERQEYVYKRRRYEERIPSTTQILKNTKNVKVTYMNPKAQIWNEESSVSVPVETSEEINKMMLTDNSSSSHKCEHFRNIGKDKRRISQNHSISDKLAILTTIASTEVEKAQLWNKIWNQAKNHCKSKQDTVIIQVPTKMNRKGVGITEVEFTIEDIQKLVNDPKLIRSIDNLPEQTSHPGNMESFLLIRSRKILEDVHKRLGTKFLRNA